MYRNFGFEGDIDHNELTMWHPLFTKVERQPNKRWLLILVVAIPIIATLLHGGALYLIVEADQQVSNLPVWVQPVTKTDSVEISQPITTDTEITTNKLEEHLRGEDLVYYKASEFKYGYKDRSTGKTVLKPIYNLAFAFNNGLAQVMIDNKWGYIDIEGNIVVPIKYEATSLFTQGLSLVKLNGKYGYVDTTGKEIITIKYDRAAPFSDGAAKVKLNGKEFYINHTGSCIKGCP